MILVTYLTLTAQADAPECALSNAVRLIKDIFINIPKHNLNLVEYAGDATIICGSLSQADALDRITTAPNYDKIMELCASIDITIDVIEAVN